MNAYMINLTANNDLPSITERGYYSSTVDPLSQLQLIEIRRMVSKRVRDRCGIEFDIDDDDINKMYVNKVLSYIESQPMTFLQKQNRIINMVITQLSSNIINNYYIRKTREGYTEWNKISNIETDKRGHDLIKLNANPLNVIDTSMRY